MGSMRAAFHEYVAMWHDIKRTAGLRNRLGILFHGPGWTPPGTEVTESSRG